ncbi:single-stranded DNA-binding protein [Dactylosporangium sp. CA-233914]|uniref:single-stranded DNA-binding protein n=1 Tax=Dactylosporangium sp. CA-233914 TaxID=3239934 RepID=UPI003D919EB0
MQPLFSVLIEGTLRTSPTAGVTRDAREYVQFEIVHRRQYRDDTGKQADAKPMYFDVLCWGDVATRARSLSRGDDVIVEAGQLLAYTNDDDLPALKLFARNLSISMRRRDAHPGPARPARRADLITTGDGEQYTADAYPDTVTDRERVHN